MILKQKVFWMLFYYTIFTAAWVISIITFNFPHPIFFIANVIELVIFANLYNNLTAKEKIDTSIASGEPARGQHDR